MADVVPIFRLSLEQRRVLVREALQTLRGANVLGDYDADVTVDSLAAWYDAVIPDITDIKELAGELEIQLMLRRGKLLLAEGERRGGDQKSEQIKVDQRSTLKKAERDQRVKDRVVASQPEAVAAYVQRERAAGRARTGRGAIRAAKAARGPTQKVRKPATTLKRIRTLAEQVEAFRVEVRERIKLVHGQALTEAELAQRWGGVIPDNKRRTGFGRYLRETHVGGEVTIDGDLITVSFSKDESQLYDFARTTHAEVVVRRKEAFDGYHGWKPDTVHTARQEALIAWVESECSPCPHCGRNGPTALTDFKRTLAAGIIERLAEWRVPNRWRPNNAFTVNQSACLDWVEDMCSAVYMATGPTDGAPSRRVRAKG